MGWSDDLVEGDKQYREAMVRAGQVIEMCTYYMVRNMKPACEKGRWAGLKCHSERKSCPDYEPSKVGEPRKE